MECSKKLLIFSWSVTILLTILTIVLPIAGVTSDGLFIVTPLSWTETGAAAGFYYWKSKNENRAKYAQRFVHKYAHDYGIDAAARIAEIVLKD